MTTSLKAIDERYFYLVLRYTELIEKCKDAEQEKIVNTLFTAAVAAHNEALERIFNENAQAVKSLRESLRSNTAALKKQMNDDEEIVQILNTLTAGGQLAQDLLKKGKAKAA